MWDGFWRRRCLCARRLVLEGLDLPFEQAQLIVDGGGAGFGDMPLAVALRDFRLSMANSNSRCDWEFKQPVAMALPAVILHHGCLRCWVARFLPGRVPG